MTRPARVEVDLAAARHNLNRVRELAPRSKVLGVIKANGYGHGLTTMARAFAEADALGVACIEEAERLRQAGVTQPILLLEGPFHADEVALAERLGLDLVIHNQAQTEMLNAAVGVRPFTVWLKIDTGMHRLGFPMEDLTRVYRELNECSNVAPDLVLMTHFANAHAPNDPLNQRQLERFLGLTAHHEGPASAANSGATLNLPESHLDWVRPGLMLYGISPCRGLVGSDHGLQPVMTLYSELIAVREIDQGETVGYGAAWRCPERMPVGVVALGYGDGYPRAASGAPVVVNGFPTRVIGMPSMDMLTVDLRGVRQPKVGDRVEFWGPNLAVEAVADAAGTIPYELVSGVRARAHHVVIDKAKVTVPREGVNA